MEAQQGAPFHKYGQSKIALYSCNYLIQLTNARFCQEDKSIEWCYCNNFNAFSTISHCYKVAHPNQVDSLLNMCLPYNKTLDIDVFYRANNYYDNHAQEVNISNSSMLPIVQFPAKLNDSETFVFQKAYQSFLGNFDVSVDYGAYLVLYWVAVFCLAALGNWSKIWFPQINRKLTDPLTNWFRKTISLPATGRKNKTNEQLFAYVLDMLIPTRAETLILLASVLLCAYLFTANISYVEGDPLFHTKGIALLRYYAVRASILSSFLMPLLILFGGRNNFLQWFTRWDYSTFITLHRWVSREIMVMILIHSFNYSLYIHLRSHNPLQTYIYFGVAASIAGVAILIQGLLVLRRAYYELFLLLHIILAAVFIFGAWVHVEDLYCVWFYYTSAAIWGFDRAIRICRLYSFGAPLAKVYLLADETLKVVVPRPPNWDAIPGGHAFIHFLRPSCFWQSHPFTYTYTEVDIVLFIKVKKGVTLRLANYLKTHKEKYTKIRVAIEGSYGEATPAHKYDRAVFAAGGNGIPGIYSEVVAIDNSRKHCYGGENENKQSLKLFWVVREYSSLFWFYEELLRLKEHTNIETIVYITRPHLLIDKEDFDKRVISIMPDLSELNELSPLISKGEQQEQQPQQQQQQQQPQQQQQQRTKIQEDLRPTVFNESTSNSFNNEEFISTVKSELSHITIIEDRPNIEQVVRTNIKESMGSTCFITCGHPGMVDDIRASVVNNIDNDESKRVDYFEQLQVWA